MELESEEKGYKCAKARYTKRGAKYKENALERQKRYIGNYDNAYKHNVDRFGSVYISYLLNLGCIGEVYVQSRHIVTDRVYDGKTRIADPNYEHIRVLCFIHPLMMVSK